MASSRVFDGKINGIEVNVGDKIVFSNGAYIKYIVWYLID